jgi:pimeloyl-ACP methyl ester carboxylesterase
MLKKILLYSLGALIVLYLLIVLIFYFYQERIGLGVEKLPQDHVFQCEVPYEELTITSFDGIKLNGVLVKADSAKGLILYLHGSGGNIDKYMEDVPLYAKFDYDIFYLDYRGYGKSEGNMINEKQFTDDLDAVYDYMRGRYLEKDIVIIGFSMGTFAGSYLAANNQPKLLILNDPPYWIIEQFIDKFWFLPVEQITKYSFETYKYVNNTKAPVLIFLGGMSHLSKETRWQQVLKPEDELIIVKKAGHQDFVGKEPYMSKLKEVL